MTKHADVKRAFCFDRLLFLFVTLSDANEPKPSYILRSILRFFKLRISHVIIANASTYTCYFYRVQQKFIPRDRKSIPRDEFFVPRDGNPVPREKYPVPWDGNPVPHGTVNFPVIGTVSWMVAEIFLSVIWVSELNLKGLCKHLAVDFVFILNSNL